MIVEMINDPRPIVQVSLAGEDWYAIGGSIASIEPYYEGNHLWFAFVGKGGAVNFRVNANFVVSIGYGSDTTTGKEVG